MSPRRLTRNEKVLKNQGLVRSLIIAKYGKSNAHDEDLNQAGLIGLCLAADSYDHNRITGRFSSYARTCIVSELAKCSLANGKRLLPHRRFYERVAIQRHVASLAHVIGRDPTTAEIIESWQGSRAPTPAAVDRALRPDPVIMVEAVREVYDGDHEFAEYGDSESIEIEDLIDAKRRFERLTQSQQHQLTRGRR